MSAVCSSSAPPVPPAVIPPYQGAQHQGDELHGQEHDGLRRPRGRDHRHPSHHAVQCQERGQLLHPTQGNNLGNFDELID